VSQSLCAEDGEKLLRAGSNPAIPAILIFIVGLFGLVKGIAFCDTFFFFISLPISIYQFLILYISIFDIYFLIFTGRFTGRVFLLLYRYTIKRKHFPNNL
jgi:hypothetical protein